MSRGIYIECDSCGRELHNRNINYLNRAIAVAIKNGWILGRLDFCCKECEDKFKTDKL